MKIKREFSRVEWNWNVSFELPIKFNFSHKYERTRCRSEIKRYRNRIVKSDWETWRKHGWKFCSLFSIHFIELIRREYTPTKPKEIWIEVKEKKLILGNDILLLGHNVFFLSSVFSHFTLSTFCFSNRLVCTKLNKKNWIDWLLRNCKYKISFWTWKEIMQQHYQRWRLTILTNDNDDYNEKRILMICQMNGNENKWKILCSSEVAKHWQNKLFPVSTVVCQCVCVLFIRKINEFEIFGKIILNVRSYE